MNCINNSGHTYTKLVLLDKVGDLWSLPPFRTYQLDGPDLSAGFVGVDVILLIPLCY